MSVQPGRRIAGVVVMLLGVALIGYGAHYLIRNGTCPGTGYAAGPVPACGGGEGPYTVSVFFLGPALAVLGWRLARLWGALWPTVCIALCVGLVTVRVGQSATAVAKAFGPVAGTCFLAFALASAVIAMRKWLRTRRSPAGTPVRPAGPGATVVVETPASRASGRDMAAKPAEMRCSGALTEEESGRDKAAPLARI
jgi:hypothetical protein